MATTSPGAPLLTRQNGRYAGIAALLALSVPLTNRIYQNYQAWIALGGGGVPYNFGGWLIQWVLQLLSPRASRMTKTSEFNDSKVIAKYEPLGSAQLLTPQLPFRAGARPHVPVFFAPQRQVPGNSAAVRTLQRQAIDRIVDANADLVEVRPSGMEGVAATAIWVKDTSAIPTGARIKRALGEAAHMHLHADGSSHVILSLADARQVIEKGWGQKHLGSGGLILPHGYVMLYAPSTEDDVLIIEKIIKAAIGFMSGGKVVH